MNLLKFHRGLIGSAALLSLLFFLRYFLGLLEGEGQLLVLLVIGVVAGGLVRYFLYLRASGLPGLAHSPQSEGDSEADASEEP